MTLDEFEADLRRFSTEALDISGQSIWAQGIERVASDLRGVIGANESQVSWMLGPMPTILLDEYLLYQNYGVSGSKSSYSNIRQSEADGRVYAYGTSAPPASAFSRYTTEESAQFAIATKVHQFGIPPKNWFSIDGNIGYNMTRSYTQHVQEFLNNIQI
jgi:hypothetical protein